MTMAATSISKSVLLYGMCTSIKVIGKLGEYVLATEKVQEVGRTKEKKEKRVNSYFGDNWSHRIPEFCAERL